MLTDTQEGRGPSLSGLPPKNDRPAQGSVAANQSASKSGFAAVLAESDSETVDAETPMIPTADAKRTKPAPSDAGRSTADETEGSGSSRDPDTKRTDADGADETAIWGGVWATSKAIPTSTTPGAGRAEHTVMTATGVGIDGPAGATHALARGMGEQVGLPASPDDTTVPTKPGVAEIQSETKAAPVAARPIQTLIGPLSDATSRVGSHPERAAAAQDLSVPLSASAPTSGGAAQIAARDTPLAHGGLSRSGSVSSEPTFFAPESARRSGEEIRPGRPNGSPVTPSVSLPGVTYSGSPPAMGGPGLSFLGSLPRSEHAQTSDGGPTGPDARLSGQHASATSLAAPVATYRNDLPQQIVVQIAAAAEKAKTGTQKTIDLSLNPEELGRVRLRLSPSEGGLNVMILAERSETLDLLRRNIDMLAREFLEIGYEGATFDFTGGQQEQADGDASIPLPTVEDLPDTIPRFQAGETHVLALGDRIDIRL